MKRITPLILAALLCSGAAISQNNQWTEAFARVDGATVVKGVEVQSMQSECDAKDVVFIKIINHNDYEVKMEWTNAALINKSWMNNPKQKVKSSIVIESKGAVNGSCESTIAQLIVNVSDFGISVDEMKYFHLTDLAIDQVIN